MSTLRQKFLAHVAQTSPGPLALEITDAKGVYLTDSSGKKYIDLIAGISVSNVGHCHPHVVKAVQDQAEKFMHLMVYGEYIHSPQVRLSAKIAALTAIPDAAVYLVNSGAEAIEGGLKLAKRFTGRAETVSFKNSYHGSTQGALSIMGSETFKQSFRPLIPGNTILPYNDVSVLEQITERTAAVVIEPVQGEAGVIVPEKNYLKQVEQRCKETGALLILDEIQTGFGRTGSLFKFHTENIQPDILVLAKGMGGGMPIGAFVARQEIMQTLQNDPVLGHITTFGGHPVCAAASLAAIEVLENEKLVRDVEEKSKLFVSLLKHPQIKEIRACGLLLALQFDNFENTKAIIDRCIENGVITDWFLFNDSSLRIAPPLTISPQEIQRACEVIVGAIG